MLCVGELQIKHVYMYFLHKCGVILPARTKVQVPKILKTRLRVEHTS